MADGDPLDGMATIERGSVALAVRVTPKSSRSAIGAALPDGGRALAVRIAAPPVDGAANAALIALLAKSLVVRRSDVRIVAGEGSRLKRVHIVGDGPVIASRLAALIPDG